MLHVIADRWAALFTFHTLMVAVAGWLAAVFVHAEFTRHSAEGGVRRLLFAPRSVFFLYVFAWLGAGSEYATHHRESPYWMQLVAGLSILVLLPIAMVIGKFRGKKDIQGR